MANVSPKHDRVERVPRNWKDSTWERKRAQAQRMLEIVAFGREVVDVDWNFRLDDNNIY